MAMLTTIPFQGFYNSIHSQEVARIWEYECEIFAEDAGENMPEWVSEIVWRDCDYSEIYDKYAAAYAESFCNWMEFDNAVFDGMESPREYNFETDRLFVHITRHDVAKLVRYVRNESANGWQDMRDLAKRQFTSRSGFISYYDPDIDAWGSIAEWDHNQIGTLVECAAIARNGGEWGSMAEYKLIEHLDCNGDFSEWFWGSNDKMRRLSNALYYIREVRSRRQIKTMAQWHAARRAENRLFNQTPLGESIQ